MPKINHEEYEVLKELDDKWEWIARDEDRGLYAFTEKPVRNYGPSPYWWDKDGWDVEPYSALELIDKIHLFQFIQWEDGEPYNIQELIEEYEDSKEYKDSLVIEYFMDKAKESEETEVKKDKKWLEDEVDKIVGEYQSENIFANFTRYMIYDIKDVINQLDEPEVLSQEWISENVEYAYFDMLDGSGRLSSATAIIKPKKLQNLLVPKQEEVDRAYRKGFKEGERQTAEYFESITEEPSKEQVWKYLSEHGIEVVDKEPETVADVVTTFWKSYERLKEVMNMEVEELEE